MLFVGDDWASDHHDVELQDPTGRVLVRRQLPEGVEGIARFHALVAEYLPEYLPEGLGGGLGGGLGEGVDPRRVTIGIETDRGPWVAALVAAGYRVIAVNPLSVARYRERYSTSGAKSDAGDAHVLADLVRLDADRHREVAGDSDLAEGLKVLTRAHQRLIWDRARQVLRLQAALREYFPAALAAFDDLTAPDALELLATAPDPQRAGRLARRTVTAALRRARRRDIEAKATAIITALRSEQLGRSPVIDAAYAATVSAAVALIGTLNTEIARLQGEVESSFGRHPDAEIVVSQPGLGTILGARVLAEFGDDPGRYTDARARKNYAGQAPITRASGKTTTVLRRYVRNQRLAGALHQQALSALTASPGARAYYDQLRARGKTHNAALRQLSNRLVGILHGCLKTHTPYNEHTAWNHHHPLAA